MRYLQILGLKTHVLGVVYCNLRPRGAGAVLVRVRFAGAGAELVRVKIFWCGFVSAGAGAGEFFGAGNNINDLKNLFQIE